MLGIRSSFVEGQRVPASYTNKKHYSPGCIGMQIFLTSCVALTIIMEPGGENGAC